MTVFIFIFICFILCLLYTLFFCCAGVHPGQLKQNKKKQGNDYPFFCLSLPFTFRSLLQLRSWCHDECVMCLLARDEASTFSAKPLCGWGQFSLASTAGWRSRSNGAGNLQPHPQNGIHTYQHTQICGCHSLLVHFCTHGVGATTSAWQSDLCVPWQLIQQAFAQDINFIIQALPAGGR